MLCQSDELVIPSSNSLHFQFYYNTKVFNNITEKTFIPSTCEPQEVLATPTPMVFVEKVLKFSVSAVF
jgi:hypothetical protein